MRSGRSELDARARALDDMKVQVEALVKQATEAW